MPRYGAIGVLLLAAHLTGKAAGLDHEEEVDNACKKVRPCLDYQTLHQRWKKFSHSEIGVHFWFST
jgi:hypothetical protein